MNRIPIGKQWYTFMDFVGGDKNCEHEVDDDALFDETEYGGSYICLKCNCKMTFDVSDIGD